MGEAAGAALEELNAVRNRRDESRKVDEATTVRLTALADKAQLDLSKREHIAARVSARLAASRETHREATKEHRCVLASLTAVLGDLETHKLRLDGPFHSEMERSAMALRAAEEASVVAQQRQSEAPQRHKEDAEAIVLQRQEAAEATLVEALNEARVGALEAHEESADETSSSDLGILLKTAKELVASWQERVQKSTDERVEAGESVKQAHKVLEACRQQLAKHIASVKAAGHTAGAGHHAAHGPEADSDVELRQHVARAEAHVAYVEQLDIERQAAQAAAETAAQAAAEGLQFLEKHDKSSSKVVTPLEVLLHQEMEVVSDLIRSHQEAQSGVLEGVEVASQQWELQRQTLSVSLHNASVREAVAKDAVDATKNLQRSVTAAVM